MADLFEKLKEMAARADAATPGPWKHEIDTSWGSPDRIIVAPLMVIIRDEKCDKHYKEGRDEANYEFIAAARIEHPALAKFAQRITQARNLSSIEEFIAEAEAADAQLRADLEAK